jgi:uncharacterized protein YgiM (DUF1202 family)
VARTLASLGLFLAVILIASLTTVWGLQSIGANLSKVAALSTVQTTVRPNYVSTLRVVEPEALNVATTTRVVPAAPSSILDAAPQATFTHTVAVESLRVRSGPNKMTPQLFALKGGTQVTVIKADSGWVMVDAGHGRIGWVYPKFLRPAAAASQLQAEL